MAVLVFNVGDVKRVVKHSITHEQRPIPDWPTAVEGHGWDPKYVSPTMAHVILVHDQGVYLMSNGKSTKGVCAYARGCHPDIDPDWYEKARELVGGDDFAEYLPWAEILLEAINTRKLKRIVVKISGDSIQLGK